MVLMGMVFFLTNAFAEKHTITFEMAESGQIVTFPLSLEEIAVADALDAFKKTQASTNITQTKKWVNRIELPESGQYVEFPMTDEEIQVAVIKAAKEKADRYQRYLNAPDDRKEDKGQVIEMADGSTVTFYRYNQD